MSYLQRNADDLSVPGIKILYGDDTRLKVRIFRKKQDTVSLSFIPFQGGFVSVDAGGHHLTVVGALLPPDQDQIAGVDTGIFHALSIDTEKEIILFVGVWDIRISLDILKGQHRIPGRDGAEDGDLVGGGVGDGVGGELFFHRNVVPCNQSGFILRDSAISTAVSIFGTLCSSSYLLSVCIGILHFLLTSERVRPNSSLYSLSRCAMFEILPVEEPGL